MHKDNQRFCFNFDAKDHDKDANDDASDSFMGISEPTLGHEESSISSSVPSNSSQ